MGIFSFLDKSTIYFQGCYSRAFGEDKLDNYSKILKKLGVNFSLLNEEGCCGGFLDEAGYEKQFRKISRELKDKMKEQGVKKIITNCPMCFKIFSKDYKEMMPDWDIETEFILTTIFNKLVDNQDLIKFQIYEHVLYIDSCYLGRYCNMYSTPRELLFLLGYDIIELDKNKEEGLCDGSCGGLKHTNSELADKITEEMIKKIKLKKMNKVVVADMRIYKNIKEKLESIGEKDIEIIEISELIKESMKLK